MSGPDVQAQRSSEHAEMQRHRILDAAEQCFIDSGFHAASMANIAEKAQMSPGLIYRYFANKSAIILAIIERQICDRHADIAKLQSQSDFIERLVTLFTSWIRRENRTMNPVLFLEMTAEASRDPKVAEALAKADESGRHAFAGWLKRMANEAGREVSDEDVEKRAFALQCFIEGLAVRAVRQPDIDSLVLAESARLFVPRLLWMGEC